MSTNKMIKITDAGKDTDKLTSVAVDDLMTIPADFEEKEWAEISEEIREKYVCILDDVNILPIPKPVTAKDEEELVNKFINGMRKLFTKEDNWTFLSMLETTMENCAKCNTCSDSCHLYEASGGNEMYRPNYRTEIFRRIYKKYVKKGWYYLPLLQVTADIAVMLGTLLATWKIIFNRLAFARF